MVVPVEISRILIRENEDLHIVELREVDGDRVLPITIGLYEAVAIERRIMGKPPIRPQTHELLESVIEGLGAEIDRIIISDLRDGMFFARLILVRDGETYDIDSRPSDAMALGVARETPIFVEEHVLDDVDPDAD